MLNGKKINGVKKGTTAIHYIFENVKLQKGKNRIEALAGKDDKVVKDQIEWSF
ncbi:hypothetical protein D3C85_1626660 [compost metagenome]